jgi:hypothetical protein
MSPENTAADLGTALPLSQAEPFAYNIAEAESAASNCAGTNIASRKLNADRSAFCDMAELAPAIFKISINPIPQKGRRSMMLLTFSLFFHHYFSLWLAAVRLRQSGFSSQHTFGDAFHSHFNPAIRFSLAFDLHLEVVVRQRLGLTDVIFTGTKRNGLDNCPNLLPHKRKLFVGGKFP